MKSLQNWKAYCFLLAFALPLFLGAQETNPTDSTGFDGDHFSLEGALELFKNAKSPEDFEKALNSEKNYVNNLDLNEDGKIDYVRVEDHVDGDVHAIVLQVPVSEKESQDIAVIEIEKTGDKSAILQIIGDEEVYGEQKIVEPFEEETKGGGKGGPSVELGVNYVVVNVWGWNCVSFVYRPTYRVWVSPFRWAAYPVWWTPWRPHPWRFYHTRRVRYHTSFRVVTTHRVVRAHRVYTPRRKTSRVVTTRTSVTRVNKKKGPTVTRTTKTTAVKGPNGGVAKKKTTTTKVKGPNGGVAKKKKTSTSVKGPRGNGVKKTTTKAGAKGPKGGGVGRKSTTVRRKKKN